MKAGIVYSGSINPIRELACDELVAHGKGQNDSKGRTVLLLSAFLCEFRNEVNFTVDTILVLAVYGW